MVDFRHAENPAPFSQPGPCSKCAALEAKNRELEQRCKKSDALISDQVREIKDQFDINNGLQKQLAEAKEQINTYHRMPWKFFPEYTGPNLLRLLESVGMGKADSPHGNTMAGMVEELVEKYMAAQEQINHLTKTCDEQEKQLAEAKAKIEKLRTAILGLYPHIDDQGMEGASEFERAWLLARAALAGEGAEK